MLDDLDDWHGDGADAGEDLRRHLADLYAFYGEQTGVHVSEVDYVIEGDDRPAPELAKAPGEALRIDPGQISQQPVSVSDEELAAYRERPFD